MKQVELSLDSSTNLNKEKKRVIKSIKIISTREKNNNNIKHHNTNQFTKWDQRIDLWFTILDQKKQIILGVKTHHQILYDNISNKPTIWMIVKQKQGSNK